MERKYLHASWGDFFTLDILSKNTVFCILYINILCYDRTTSMYYL